MAGAFGSIKHLHEERNITYSEIKTIISNFKSGNQIIYEKFDGQNLLVTMKNGEVRVARNKPGLTNPYSLYQLQSLFEDKKEHVKVSFSEAMQCLEEFIYGFDMNQVNQFFKDGKVFLNCEIINPLVRNQIDYGETKKVILTGAIVTDGNGAIISNLEVDSLDWLTNEEFNYMNWKVELYKQLNYEADDLVDDTLQAINEFMSVNGLNDSHKISAFLENKIFELIDRFKLTDNQKVALKNRWVYGDKSLKLNHINYGISSVEISQYEKGDLILDIINLENDYVGIIQTFGNNLLKLISDQDERMQNTETIINTYISSLEYVKVMEFNVDKHLLSIKNMGGLQNVRNIEGIVFYYKDKLYKLTGLFQPINQICGYFKYRK